jgi:hypothetical protein
VINLWWNTNNSTYKPQRFSQGTGSSGYYYLPSNTPGQRLGFETANMSGSTTDRPVLDPVEAKAYADFSLTGSIARESQGGAIEDYVDDSYFGDSHSNEWVWKIQKLKTFYNTLLLKFELPRNP